MRRSGCLGKLTAKRGRGLVGRRSCSSQPRRGHPATSRQAGGPSTSPSDVGRPVASSPTPSTGSWEKRSRTAMSPGPPSSCRRPRKQIRLLGRPRTSGQVMALPSRRVRFPPTAFEQRPGVSPGTATYDSARLLELRRVALSRQRQQIRRFVRRFCEFSERG